MADYSLVKAPSSASSHAGGEAWDNPNNILVQEGNRAISDIPKNGNSQWIRGYNYNFNIESDATILGIQMRLRLQSENAGNVSDSQVYVTDTGGNNKGGNKATGNDWPTSDTDFFYGGSTDLWGASWSVADINHVNFGAQVEAANSSGTSSRQARVDYMEITVYYSRPDAQGMLLQMGAF